jgi:hypothetical protein
MVINFQEIELLLYKLLTGFAFGGIEDPAFNNLTLVPDLFLDFCNNGIDSRPLIQSNWRQVFLVKERSKERRRGIGRYMCFRSCLEEPNGVICIRRCQKESIGEVRNYLGKFSGFHTRRQLGGIFYSSFLLML